MVMYKYTKEIVPIILYALVLQKKTQINSLKDNLCGQSPARAVFRTNLTLFSRFFFCHYLVRVPNLCGHNLV